MGLYSNYKPTHPGSKQSLENGVMLSDTRMYSIWLSIPTLTFYGLNCTFLVMIPLQNTLLSCFKTHFLSSINIKRNIFRQVIVTWALMGEHIVQRNWASRYLGVEMLKPLGETLYGTAAQYAFKCAVEKLKSKIEWKILCISMIGILS